MWTRTIGYKEFRPYLSSRPVDSTEIDQTDEKFICGLEAMKCSTRQYAKKQVQWIRRQLIPLIEKVERDEAGGEVTIVLLDASDLTKWDERIAGPAVEMMQSICLS